MVKERSGHIRSRLIICAAAMGLVLGFAARGEAASYTFTKLEDTSGSFLWFGFTSINDVGTVAFSAALDTDSDGIMDGSGIFTSNGTTTTTIADGSDGFGFFGPPSINDGGTVAFWATLGAGGNGIFSSDGTTTTTIADNSGSFSSFNSPSINNSGTVAFWASLDGGGTTGIFTSDGTTTTTIVDTNGPISSPNLPLINNGGTVVFTGIDDVEGNGIFAGSGGAVSTIVNESGPFSFFNSPSNNDGGTVVFWARLDTGAFGIFTNDGTTVADTGGPFSNFSSPSINDGGTVAFQGFLSGSNGIFTGPDPVADKVIAIGDPLSGSTVTTVIFSREGLNDAGQIAFVASLANGTQAVYLADPEDGGDPVPPGPVPLPPPSPDPDLDPVNVTIDIKPGSDRNSVNLSSQGVVRVAILSTSTFDAATVDPASINLSGAYEKQKGKGTLMASYKDVNRDGYLDLVIHVQTQSLSLAESTTATAESTPKVTLTGMTYNGTIITGSDSIHSVP